jgi:hypothetical protein
VAVMNQYGPLDVDKLGQDVPVVAETRALVDYLVDENLDHLTSKAKHRCLCSTSLKTVSEYDYQIEVELGRNVL